MIVPLIVPGMLPLSHEIAEAVAGPNPLNGTIRRHSRMFVGRPVSAKVTTLASGAVKGA
jgi:hypothetical protein